MTERVPGATISNPIAARRQALGLTQAQLAEKAGVIQQTIDKWERGERNPGVPSLKKLAAALGCSVADLIKE